MADMVYYARNLQVAIVTKIRFVYDECHTLESKNG